MRKTVMVLLVLSLSACTDTYNRTPLYKDISGQGRPSEKLQMVEAYCRNMVNSHVQPYEGSSGVYSTSNAGSAFNSSLDKISRAMSGPNYQDCMLSQGYQLVGYE